MYVSGETTTEEQDRAAIVRELLAAGVPPTLRDSEMGWSVVDYTAYYGRPQILAELIRAAGPHAADMVNERDNAGWTALATASRGGYEECVGELIVVHLIWDRNFAQHSRQC